MQAVRPAGGVIAAGMEKPRRRRKRGRGTSAASAPEERAQPVAARVETARR
jgi:hypothetical protein